MKDIKVTSKHGGELLTYTDTTSGNEVTIGHMEDYYFGWYYVEEEENSYQGQMAEGDSLEMVIGALALFTGMDFGLRYGGAEEMVDLLKKVQTMYPQS